VPTEADVRQCGGQFLRQAVERNLSHYHRVERAAFARLRQQGMRWRDL